MSYWCRYKTIMVDLGDGNILDIARQGCNNDDSGRTDYDWDWTLTTRKNIASECKHLRDISEYEFECKVGSRATSFVGLAEHYERMLKRAITWEEFDRKYSWCFKIVKSVTVTKPQELAGEYSREEWHKAFNDYSFKPNRYWCNYDYIENIDDIVGFISTKGREHKLGDCVAHGVGGMYVKKRTWVK